jgi:hypothetical protein
MDSRQHDEPVFVELGMLGAESKRCQAPEWTYAWRACWSTTSSSYTPRVCPPNGLSLSCTARAHVPKPTRHGGCRRGVAEPRLAICNRRVAAHSSVLTSRLGRRASAGP